MTGRVRTHLGQVTRTDLVDLALALLMALAASVETLMGNFERRSTASVLVVGLLVVLPLAARRRAPMGTYLTVLAVVTAEAAVFGSNEGVSVFFGVLVGIYTVAAHTGRRTALIALGLTLLVMAFTNWRVNGNPFQDLEFMMALFGGFWIVGRVVWSREQLVRQLSAQSEELRRTRAAETRALVAEERARIARDVHDVVAHSVSIMVVQAEAGEALLPDRERSGAAFRTIQGVGRSTLAELRNLLGALDDGGDESADGGAGPRRPSPRLGDAQRLVDEFRSAGLEVVLRIDGDASRLPDGVDLAAFRVLQESLTNALRHSGGHRVEAQVRVDSAEVTVEVEDEGPARAAGDAGAGTKGAGRGLIGMRERVRLYGGDVHAGPTERGFRIQARIPFAAAEQGVR